jgi:hypothetical protein
MLALPIAAGGAPCAASGILAADLPGIDEVRVAIPAGTLGGHAVSVREIRSRLLPADALSQIERHWRAQGAQPVLRADAGEWSVLSRRVLRASHVRSRHDEPTAEAFETLQLRSSARGGSVGLVTIWQPRAPDPVGEAASAAVSGQLTGLLPDDARALRELESHDAGRRSARTLIAHFDRSLEDCEAHVERHLRRRGYAPMRADTARRPMNWRDDRARFYGAPQAEVLVTLHRQPQGTDVVLHHVSAK